MLLTSVVVCFTFHLAWAQKKDFPPGFIFGASTASYQIEGGWNADDRTPNIWDVFTHTYPEKIADRSNGDVACDSFNQWERDIEMAGELGLDFYRFSISWTRVLPTGLPNNVSEAGTRYYNNLIDGLLAKGIKPVVTIYHWELPERLQKLGGWTNPLIADWLADYARVLYGLFGDRVKTWITINEPIMICDLGYNSGINAPPIADPGVGNLICIKNLLIAHAKAYRVYDEEFRSKCQGEVGISNHLMWFEPESAEYEDLTNMVLELSGGLYCHPIYSKEGGWPSSIEKRIAENSKKEGYPRSRLPAFTDEEKKLVQGTYDFFAVNHYTSRVVREPKPGEVLNVASWPVRDAPELNAKCYTKSEWPNTASSWSAINPEGIRHILQWIKKQYGDVKILITENGYGSSSQTLDDVERLQYYESYLEQVLLAIKEDGIKVVGYTAWSLMDNFEWTSGYTVKYGLYNVDFDDPERTRTPRSSAYYYASVIHHRSLNVTI